VGSESDSVALVIAFGALAVSVASLFISAASLYLTSLRPADIEVDPILEWNHLRGEMFSGEYPQENRLRLTLVISNAGAHGGLLRDVGLEHLSYTGEDPPYWVGVSRGEVRSGISRGDVRSGIGSIFALPLVLEAGDVETVFLTAQLETAPSADITELAQRVAGLRTIRVRLFWSFTRTAGLPKSVRRRRETVDRDLSIEVDASRYRSDVLDYWRGNP
jgi:hypothetical protein